MTVLKRKKHVATLIDYLSFTWVPVEIEAFRKGITASVTKAAEENSELWAPDWWDRSKPLTDPAKDVPRLKSAKASWIRKEVNRRITDHNPVELERFEMLLARDLLKFFDIVSPLFSSSVPDLSAIQIVPRDRGVFGYKRSSAILVEGVQVGIAATGVKNGGCFVSITGQGCTTLDFSKLHGQLLGLNCIKLTRVDIAYDDYQGNKNVKACRSMYERGLFTVGGRSPAYEYHEGGHLEQKNSVNGGYRRVKSRGCSFYVGRRENGKMLRCYEKGKQLIGLGESVADDCLDWVRWELELRNTAREIPLDVLLRPSEYLAASYPALSFIAEEGTADETCRIRTKQKTVSIAMGQLIGYARTGYGALINVMRHSLDMSDTDIVEELISANSQAIPKRLRRSLGGIVCYG